MHRHTHVRLLIPALALALAASLTACSHSAAGTGATHDSFPFPAVTAPDVEESHTCRAPDVIAAVPADLDCSAVACIALTFDDGPDPTHTPRVLDALARWGVPATFFVQGKNAAAYPDLIAREAASGHVVASHTWDHPSLPSLSSGGIADQLARTDSAVASAVGFTKEMTQLPAGTMTVTPSPSPSPSESEGTSPDNAGADAQPDASASASPEPEPEPTFVTEFVRPPYGAVSSHVYSALSARGQTAVLWNVDSEDWKNRDAAISSERVLSAVQPGSIILFHDIHPVAEQALDCLIEDLRAQGYRFVTVEQLLAGHTYPGQPVFSRDSVNP